jgi:hypothetical protein
MSDISLMLNENEQQVLANLLDGAVKHLGLSAAAAVAHFVQKLTDAQKAAQASASESEATS